MIDRIRHTAITAAGIGAVTFSALSMAAEPKAPAQICVDATCVTSAAAAASSSNGIKYHPGHYAWFAGNEWYRIDRPTTLAQILSFIDSIANEPTIQGIQITTLWGAIEGDTPGSYKFDSIDAILARCQLRGKRLMLMVTPSWAGNIDSNYTLFPKYLVDGSSYGISYGTSTEKPTRSTRYWENATMDRYIAMIQAMGRRYNSHPYMEMISFPETAIGDGLQEALLNQMRRLVPATRAVWPNTGLRISANDLWPDSLMSAVFTLGAENATAVGGPDVWPADVTQADRIFVGLDQNQNKVYKDYRDIMPWAVEIQSPELAGQWTPKQLYDATVNGYSATKYSFTMPSMKTKYIIWYVNTGWTGGSAQAWSTGELPFIRSTGGAVHTSASTCPSSYPSCITK